MHNLLFIKSEDSAHYAIFKSVINSKKNQKELSKMHSLK